MIRKIANTNTKHTLTPKPHKCHFDMIKYLLSFLSLFIFGIITFNCYLLIQMNSPWWYLIILFNTHTHSSVLIDTCSRQLRLKCSWKKKFEYFFVIWSIQIPIKFWQRVWINRNLIREWIATKKKVLNYVKMPGQMPYSYQSIVHMRKLKMYRLLLCNKNKLLWFGLTIIIHGFWGIYKCIYMFSSLQTYNLAD